MRDLLIIGGACLIAIVAGAWLFLSQEDTTASAGPTAYRVFIEGEQSGSITERKNYRIKNEEELDELWRLIYGTSGPSAPAIDFTREELLAVFDGTHSSGGYTVEVVSIEDEPGVARHVSILHTAPGESCMVSQAITSPFVIVRVAATNLPLKRTDLTETVACE